MGWLDLIRGSAPPPISTVPLPVERAAPGVAALFERLSGDRSHAVLDLGSASDASLQTYARFARRVRFAELNATGEPAGGLWSAALSSIPAQPESPYDLVLAWDVMDRMGAENRSRLVARLLEITAPNAMLHLVVEAAEKAVSQPVRYSLLDVGRVRAEPFGPPQMAGPRLLPAMVERMVAPFEVVRAYTLQVGVREYVAVRGARRKAALL